MRFSQVNLRRSREERDAALEQVNRDPGFAERVQDVLVPRFIGTTISGEGVRLLCQAQHIEPHHHNAWGSAVNCLRRRGVLVPTGRWVSSMTVTSHATAIPMYLVRVPSVDRGADGVGDQLMKGDINAA